jgi:hypothetical protein
MATRFRRLTTLLLVMAGCVAAACSKPGSTVDGLDAATPIGPPASGSAPVAQAPAAPAAFRGELSALPRGAAIYLSLDPSIFELGLAALPAAERAEIEKELAAELGLDSLSASALFERTGIDPSRPILFAVLPGDAPAAKKILERLTSAHDAAALVSARAALDELPRPMSGAFRVIIPVEDGGATKLVAAIQKAAPRGFHACPSAKGCSAFEGRAPLAIVDVKTHWAAVHERQGAVMVDAVGRALGEDDTRSVQWLAALASLDGGPEEGACSTFDTKANLSVCIRPDAAADLGTSSGYAMVLGAISGDSLDPSMKQTLLDVGMDEAERNQQLARPKTRLLDDGVLRFRGDSAAAQLELDWATTAASRPELQKAFGEPKCAKNEAIAAQLVPALTAALSPAKPEYAKPEQAWTVFIESGWAAWPIVLGRSWPTLLPVLREQVGKGAFPFEGELCAEMKGERFALVIKPDLSKLFARPTSP